MYAIVGFDRRTNTHTVLQTDIETVSDAKESVNDFREDNIPAFYISNEDYRERFGQEPEIFLTTGG